MRCFCLAWLVVFILAVPLARGEETEPNAVGEWSEWTDGLRGRLLLFKGRSMLTPDHRETLVFVELENRVGGSDRRIDVYFDPERLKCELHDDGGDAVPEHAITDGQREFYERRRPTRCWVTLPDASALRLRVSPYCAGEEVGLLIPLYDTAWMIKARDTSDYFLSGILTISPPKGHGRAKVWQGTLKLPKTKITLRKP